MSSYSWQLPGPPSGVGGAPGAGSTAIARIGKLSGLLDQEIDPVTLDYIDTETGEWSETADSRTIVLIMLETHLGRSYSAPADGTRIAEAFERGEPVTPTFVVAEITRALNVLVTAGVIADLSVVSKDERGADLVDETGRFSPVIYYRDLATGSPVDLVYKP